MIAARIVEKLLEDENYEPMSLDAIKAYVDGQKVSLADGIEFHIGFAVSTAGEGLIEDNARDNGIELDWEVVNAAIARIELNAINVLNQAGVQCRSEGHSSGGELVGSAWVTGGTPGFDFVKQQVEMGEPYRTSSGTLDNELLLPLYKEVPDEIASLIDVDIEFFDVDKIERAENGEDGE